MLHNLALDPISTQSQTGTWTRVNRNKPSERSVIDYIVVKKEDSAAVTENIVDEIGQYRIKGMKDTDHNTLLITFKCSEERKSSKITRWRTNNKEGWINFNKRMREELPADKQIEYTELEKTITRVLEETIGKVTVTIGGSGQKESKEIKELREKRKKSKAKFETTLMKKQNGNEINLAKEEYIDSQKKTEKRN